MASHLHENGLGSGWRRRVVERASSSWPPTKGEPLLFDLDTIQSAGTALPKALASAAVSFRHAADLLRHEVRIVVNLPP